MSEAHRTSMPALLLGWFLAATGLLLFFALLLGALGLGPSDGPASMLLDLFSWAAFFLPAYLGLAAVIAFMPGFRADLLFALTASLLPFSALAILAAFWNGPEVFFERWPALKTLGPTAFSVLLLGAAAASSLAIAFLRILIFCRHGPVLKRPPRSGYASSGRVDDPSGEAVRPAVRPYLLPSATGFGSGDGLEAKQDGAAAFRLPEVPPMPPLRSVGDSRLERSEAVDASPFPAELEALAELPEYLEAVEAEPMPHLAPHGDEAGDAEPSDAEPEEPEEPIPVMFHRSSEGVALPDGEALDPAADGAFWDDGQPETGGEADEAPEEAPDGRGGTRGLKAALLPKLEVFQDGEHRGALRQSPAGEAAPATDESPAAMLTANPSRLPPPALRRKKQVAYRMPTDGILNQYPDGQYWIIDEKTRRSAEVLKDTLREFNIEAEVTGIRKGPVITMFEILPAPGVRLAKIANLSDNIALRLAASSVRIVAPIPGKHAVGIEVPNERRAIVSFREIVENEPFKSSKLEIPVILGKDITGEPQIAELTQTPHLLIAGATGAGKSVCVNSIILSILYRRSFNEVKLILIDPKIVELKLYNGIPHLLTPVITESKKAFQALQYCICEMERRYSLLDAMGVRDIKSYNRKIADKKMATDRLPYIVVIIDEFADLMATTGKELESTLARLAAMSRAVGIHLVLATQRPSIDVITGLIKANIPSRIAFMVASKFDSRIIIDMVGAEKLLGRGDMLYSSATDAFPVRMQGAFVSDEEVERVVAHVKTLGAPEYIDDEIFIDDEEDEGPSLFDEDDDDPLFEKALEIVLAQGKASASFLQRKLKIGYNRAARIVELMEEKGIVGKSQGSKPRDLVRNPEFGMARPPNPKARYVPDPDGPEGGAGGDADDGDDDGGE